MILLLVYLTRAIVTINTYEHVIADRSHSMLSTRFDCLCIELKKTAYSGSVFVFIC